MGPTAAGGGALGRVVGGLVNHHIALGTRLLTELQNIESTPSTAAPTTTTTGPSSPGVGSIQTVAYSSGELKVKLTAFNVPVADSFGTPKPTYEWAAAEFTITVTPSATTDYTYDIYDDVEVLDAKGEGFDGSFQTPTTGPEFPGGKLYIPVWTTLSGWVLFEIPKAAGPYRLTFTTSQARITWAVSG
jgi:hypothetical protein